MDEKVVVITGSSGLIGSCLVSSYADKGFKVIGLDKVEPKEFPRSSEFIPCDLDRPEEIIRACEPIQALNVLINNAAISDPFNTKLGSIKLNYWNKALNVNLSSAFNLSNFLATKLRRSKGYIVNIASTRALMSEAHNEAYAACKGGLVSLTHALMNSFAPDVTVNCISPGWITDQEVSSKANTQHPSGRVGRPQDVANLCMFLTSEKARFINGQNIIIDGGMTKKMIYLE